MGQPPLKPKIYHILPIDRLRSVVADGHLWSDAIMSSRPDTGSTIGMRKIKRRRLELELNNHPGLHVGECVPFYFCPRSVMLYLIHKANHEELTYRGGQDPIVHLEADLYDAVAWAESNGKRWAFTLSNAGSRYFEHHTDLQQLGEIDWNAVQATQWADSIIKEKKQAEFLVEDQFPWSLVERIGVRTKGFAQQVSRNITGAAQRPIIEIRDEWYY